VEFGSLPIMHVNGRVPPRDDVQCRIAPDPEAIRKEQMSDMAFITKWLLPSARVTTVAAS
jgi:hypothetical protein